jgi:hypothetical protein
MEHWKDISEFISRINSNFERRNDMKKLLVVLVAVVALTGLMAGQGFGVVTDKLKVMNSAGTTTKFVVRDDGTAGMNDATARGYVLDMAAVNPASMSSQAHFSVDGTDAGGYITSLSANNFFLSSGASVVNGAWVQKSSDGAAVLAGSGGMGYRILMSTGVAPGGTPALVTRMHIDYNGNVGFGAVPTTNPLTFANGAYLTAGGHWQDASSREYKQNIEALSGEKAMRALDALYPVTYNYKIDPAEKHVGFIAEDVPDLVAAKDRKSLSPMDIVAVLTKVVQEQNKTIEALSAKIDRIEKASK